MGLVPITRVAWLLAVEQTPPTGLQTPLFTAPPANGIGSAPLGTVICRVMFDWLTMFACIFVSGVRVEPLSTNPTFVFCVGSVLGTKPVPVSATVYTKPADCTGRLAGLRDVIVAPGESTVTWNVTTIVDTGLPHVSVTVPVKTLPGCAAAKACGLNVTLIGV